MKKQLLPREVTIRYGRKGTWYEDAKGKTFKVLSSIMTPGSLVPEEVMIDLGGFLDGVFGISPKTALVMGECISDLSIVYR